MKMSRRRLLTVGGLAVIPLAVVAGRAAGRSAEDSVVRYLRAATGARNIPDDSLYQFAGQFVAANRPSDRRRFDAAMFILNHPWARALLGPERRSLLEWFERRLITDFLFSTDLFTDAGRSLERMRYVGYNDPYTLGCRSPLARFDLQA